MRGKKAKELMTRPVISARKDTSIRDISLQLLSGSYSGMPVTDEDGNVIGMVTEFDILAQIQKGRKLDKVRAGDIMVTRVLTADISTPVEEVISIMLDKDIIRLPVTEKGKLEGVIARCDIIKKYIEP